MTVYQIYPKSFADTNGDGIGDIQGIIQKLPYIVDLGVNCIWLTPIYKSPGKDNGYDVSSYTEIDPIYGTMKDFEQLATLCKDLGIIIMLDMVFNHTSSEHIWFKKAMEGDPKYRDYYIFKPSKGDGSAPTNWVSKFGGSAWEKVGEEHYLHLFDVTQPDLNWENKNLREEIYDIMDFWLSKGIRGFRFDVINLISKPHVYEDDSIGDGRRFYTDGPKIHNYLKELNSQTFGNYDCVTVGEMSSTTIENCIKYSNPSENELHMVFNFHHLKVDYTNGQKWTKAPFDFVMLKDLLHSWQLQMQLGGGAQAVFWCNHDQPRSVSRFGCDGKYHAESAKMLATAIHLMRGTPYIYQGEEIGMTNAGFTSIGDYRDVESINYYQILKESGKPEEEILDILGQKSRDNARTPMQWDSSINAGFTTGTPWIGPAKNYTKINTKAALEDKNSIFHFYKKLVSLRKESDIIAYGNYTPIDEGHESVFAYIREYKGEKFFVICNFYDKSTKFGIIGYEPILSDLVISNYGDIHLQKGELSLRPYEAVVLKK